MQDQFQSSFSVENCKFYNRQNNSNSWMYLRLQDTSMFSYRCFQM